MYSKASRMFKQNLILNLIIVSFLVLVGLTGCSSAPSLTPEKFVLSFLQKRIPLLDQSLATFYVKEEQAGIIERVKQSIATKKEMKSFTSLSAATYDLTKINVNVLDKKEKYIDDEPIVFVKLAAKGSYIQSVNGKTESLNEDEVIILEIVGSDFKVTEKIDPWK